MGFSFLLRNFPDFDRFLLILAQNLLTSSLFLNFLDVFWKYLWKWVFLPKFIKIAFFLLEIWGWCKFAPPPPQDGGFGDPPHISQNDMRNPQYHLTSGSSLSSPSFMKIVVTSSRNFWHHIIFLNLTQELKPCSTLFFYTSNQFISNQCSGPWKM